MVTLPESASSTPPVRCTSSPPTRRDAPGSSTPLVRPPMTVEPGNARSRPREQASASSVAGSARSMKLASDSGARSSSRHQCSREASERRQGRLLEVPAGEDGVREAAAEQGDARLVLFLAAAADQAARVAADEQRLAEVRPQELRQALDRGSVGGGDECDREVESRRRRRSAPSCSAASAIAASSRAPRPMALAKAIGPRRSGAGTDFLVRDDPGFPARRLDPVDQVRVRQASSPGSVARAPRAAARSCARAARPARTSRRRR